MKTVKNSYEIFMKTFKKSYFHEFHGKSPKNSYEIFMEINKNQKLTKYDLKPEIPLSRNYENNQK